MYNRIFYDIQYFILIFHGEYRWLFIQPSGLFSSTLLHPTDVTLLHIDLSANTKSVQHKNHFHHFVQTARFVLYHQSIVSIVTLTDPKYKTSLKWMIGNLQTPCNLNILATHALSLKLISYKFLKQVYFLFRRNNNKKTFCRL